MGGGNSREPYVQTRIPDADEPLQTGFTLSGTNILSGLGLSALSAGAGAGIGAIGGSILGATGTGAIIGGIAGLGIGIAGAALTNDFKLNSFKAPSAGTGGPDFLLRGGLLLPNRIVRDQERLIKMFADTKGILFTVKQNLLSRTAVKTEGGTDKLLNDGIYTPLSTLGSAGGIAIGGYLNKQGLDPTIGIGLPYVPNRYYDTVKSQIDDTLSGIEDGIITNRLYQLYQVKIANNPGIIYPGISFDDINELLFYRGGPGSTLGIGTTSIKIIDSLQRTGINNVKGKDIVLGLYQTEGINSQAPSKAREKYGRYKTLSDRKQFDQYYRSRLREITSEINGVANFGSQGNKDNNEPERTVTGGDFAAGTQTQQLASFNIEKTTCKVGS